MGISNEQFRVTTGRYNNCRGMRQGNNGIFCLIRQCCLLNMLCRISTDTDRLTTHIIETFSVLFLGFFAIFIVITLSILVENNTPALSTKNTAKVSDYSDYQLNLVSTLTNWAVLHILAKTLYNRCCTRQQAKNLIDIVSLWQLTNIEYPIIDIEVGSIARKLSNRLFRRGSQLSVPNRLSVYTTIFVYSINLILIIIATPSIVNPGPAQNSLSVAYCNAQGFILMNSIGGSQPIFQTNKLLDFQNFVFSEKPDVVIVNESWLNCHINSNEIIEEKYYKMFRFDRQENDKKRYKKKGGGGVFILVKQDLDIKTKLACVRNPHSLPIVSVEIKFSDSSKVVLSTFYRYGYSGKETLEATECYYKEICRKYNKVIIIGDLNLSSVKDWDSPYTQCDIENGYVQLFNELGLTCMINTPTHARGNILDLLLTNQPGLINNLTIEPDRVCPSDHQSVLFTMRKSVKVSKAKPRKVFKFAEADWDGLNEELNSLNWDNLFRNRNIKESWQIFKSKLDIAMRNHIPMKIVKVRIQPPWFDAEIHGMSKIKHRFRKIHKQTGLASDKKALDDYKRKFYERVADKKRQFIIADPCNDIENSQAQSQVNKKFWSFVKSGTKCGRIPEVVQYKGRHRSNRVDQCNLFNKFFCDQFSEVSNYDIAIDMPNHCNEYFSQPDVRNILRKIVPSKSPGPDAISGRILKNCASALSYPLTKLFNMSYRQGQLPDDWKTANVVPIHKKGRKDDISNYRPISLTSLVMKVFEKCLHRQIYWNCRDKITDAQHGFLPERSCTTQMLNYIDRLALGLNSKNKTDVIYFDFAKAFDSVNHDVMLDKLKKQYNINGFLLRFIREYLRGRKQQVVVDGKLSDISSVASGVPQGSILGPLLFVLFINDIIDELNIDTHALLYADDMKVFRTIKSPADHVKLQEDINKLAEWAISNKMKFHPSKCKVLESKMHNQTANSFQYRLSGTILEHTDNERDLGVIVLPNLKWYKHHRIILGKASQKLGQLRRNCSFSKSQSHRKTLYLAVVRSQFEHCSQIWRPTVSTHLKKFENLQKKGIKWIRNENFNHYTEQEYLTYQKALKILPLKQKFELNDLVAFHGLHYLPKSYLKFPSYVEQAEAVNPNIGTVRITRAMAARDDLQYTCNITPRVDPFKTSFYFRTCEIWNKLPRLIREIECKSTFKDKVSEHLWNTLETGN